MSSESGTLRRGQVFYKDRLAGELEETPSGYRFAYNPTYLKSGPPISVSLPLREAPYESKALFGFFRGHLPEGWYLAIVCATLKIDPRDTFGILLATTGGATIGAVTVRPVEEKCAASEKGNS